MACSCFIRACKQLLMPGMAMDKVEGQVQRLQASWAALCRKWTGRAPSSASISAAGAPTASQTQRQVCKRVAAKTACAKRRINAHINDETASVTLIVLRRLNACAQVRSVGEPSILRAKLRQVRASAAQHLPGSEVVSAECG